MADPSPDVYSDQMGLNMGPLGCSMMFSETVAGPIIPGVQQQTRNVATVRVSLEHLKMIAYILRREILAYEGRFGVQIPIPLEVMNQLGIGREDWDDCWRPRR